MSETRPPARTDSIIRAFTFGAALAALIAGCGRQEAVVSAPRVDATNDQGTESLVSGHGGGSRSTIGVYPLQVGNRWHYAFEFTLDTAGDGAPPEVFPAEIEVEQTLTQLLLGHEYVVEEERFLWPGDPGPSLTWWRYRQDRSGLYMADLPGNIPPGGPEPDFIVASGAFSALGRMSDHLVRLSADSRRAPGQRAALLKMARRLSGSRPITLGRGPQHGGPDEQEITRLAYPLHRGQHWIIRPDPLYEAVVEAHETLQLPAGRFQGWRIRITSELFGPRDRVHVWYGHAGLLAVHAHIEGEGTDEAGNPTGILISEQGQELDALDLVGHRHDAYGGPEESQDRLAE